MNHLPIKAEDHKKLVNILDNKLVESEKKVLLPSEKRFNRILDLINNIIKYSKVGIYQSKEEI